MSQPEQTFSRILDVTNASLQTASQIEAYWKYLKNPSNATGGGDSYNNVYNNAQNSTRSRSTWPPPSYPTSSIAQNNPNRTSSSSQPTSNNVQNGPNGTSASSSQPASSSSTATSQNACTSMAAHLRRNFDLVGTDASKISLCAYEEDNVQKCRVMVDASSGHRFEMKSVFPDHSMSIQEIIESNSCGSCKVSASDVINSVGSAQNSKLIVESDPSNASCPFTLRSGQEAESGSLRKNQFIFTKTALRPGGVCQTLDNFHT